MEIGGMMREVLVCGVGSVVGGLMFGAMHVTWEVTWYLGLWLLECLGQVRRLGPTTNRLFLRPSPLDAIAVCVAPMPLAALTTFCRETYFYNWEFSWDIKGAIMFTWCVMILHDAYFWLVHTSMHYFKPLYRTLHQKHHATGGDITVFNTAHGDILDVGLTITPFYMMLFLWVHCTSIWNPLYYMLLLFAINNVNLMGHCGYELPPWVYGPASLGALLFPGAQRPLHHYLHHIDPRVNRALYFTWWDKLTGTYLDVHPKLHLS